MVRMFSFVHALIVNSTVGKKQKQKASSCQIQLELDT